MRVLVWLLIASAGLSAESRQADFARDVQPILLAKCAACHSGEKPQAGLLLHTRADLLKGGVSGPAIVPGNSRESLLIQRVSGFRAPVMPASGDHLSDREINILRDWIDQGALPGAGPPESPAGRSLALRRPAAPEATLHQSANPIDHFVAAYFSKHGIEAPGPVSDAAFARRAYLDLWGLLPDPAQVSKFAHQTGPSQREGLVQALLADKTNYTEHWISFWNDLLRNDEGVVYHGARQSITKWLRKALADNLPYDQFVRALLDPEGADDPAGFLIGVNWRGTVSASQTPPLQAAQNSAQVFLGVNLKCNSCHDSFISNWKLKDAYGLASFFSEKTLDIYRCDVQTGEKSQARFLFPELGDVEPGLSFEERRAAAARLFTSPENGRFARTVVNRIWKKLLGRGLVEPVDEMDGEPWDAELLDWLAADFVDHGYDLKHLLARIMTSEAYQLPAVHAASPDEKRYVFRGPLVRRMTAEQFVDSVSSITGEWRVLRPAKAGLGTYSREWRLKSSPLTRALGRPIRDQVFTSRSTEATTLQALELVNGETMASLLDRGARRMLGELKPPPANLFDSGDLRSEKAVVDVDITGARQLWLLIEDSDSYDRNRVVAGWAKAYLSGPRGKVRLARLETKSKIVKRKLRLKKKDYRDSIVGAVPSQIIYDIAGKGYTRFRALAGVDESSLKSDISPKVRFFVFTEEPDRQHLVRVAEGPAAGAGSQGLASGDLIARIYRHALGREPAPEERRIAMEFLAPAVTSEGLEDLLWSIFLSPEFQYIE